MVTRSIRTWITRKARDKESSTVGPLLAYLLRMYRFHPKERFLGSIRFKYGSIIGKWTALSFPRTVVQRVFYVCSLNMLGDRKVIKIPKGDNEYSCRLIYELRDKDKFLEYKKLLTEMKDDPWMGKHSVQVYDVRPDGGYTSEYIEGLNLAHLRDEFFTTKELPGHLRGDLINALQELLASLRGSFAEHGVLYGDWALANLVFSPERVAVINVDMEGFFTFDGSENISYMTFLENQLGDLLDLLKLLDRKTTEGDKTVAALRILDEVRRSGEAYSGQQFLVGYHSLNLNGKRFHGQRNCEARIEHIPFNFKDKVVVDLGCNSGGMLHSLSNTINKGYGFDYNPKCINAAQSIKRLNSSNNLEFFVFDLDNDDLSLVPEFVIPDKVDICFLLSVCMWLEDWREVIGSAAALSETLLFESNGTPDQQLAQYEHLKVHFEKLEMISEGSSDDPLQKNRRLYLCSESKNFRSASAV